MAPQLASGVKDLLEEYLVAKLQDKSSDSAELTSREDKLIKSLSEFEPDFCTKCHVLNAVLRAPRLNGYLRHASALLSSLCDLWWTGKTDIEEVDWLLIGCVKLLKFISLKEPPFTIILSC